MQTGKLSTKGQFVIPNEIRKRHHLVAGTEFTISFVGDEIRLAPLPIFPDATVEEAAGLLANRGVNKADKENTHARIAKALKVRDAATR